LSAQSEERFGFDCDGLRIEGLLHRGDGPLAAVVLHPHPQYGGDMHNHVVAAACQALARHGATTLRFNFRGVGGSEGGYDGGRGEAEDARNAIAAVRALAPGAGLVLAGYSFGAMVAAGIAGAADLAGLVLISPPVSAAPLAQLPDGLHTLIIAGERDDLAPAGPLASLGAPERRVVAVPGADHGWWPGIEVLAAEIIRFVAELAPA
jgi:hypothetical protein